MQLSQHTYDIYKLLVRFNHLKHKFFLNFDVIFLLFKYTILKKI